MGDDHNIVYPYAGKWVYRASAIGSCERALFAARRGLSPTPPPGKLQDAYDEGHRAEDYLLQRFFEDHTDHTRLTDPPSDMVTVEGNQMTVRVPVGDAVLRGSLDALSQHGNHLYVVDAKAVGPDLWKAMVDKEKIPSAYVDQQHVYMAGVGAKEAILACGRKVDGVIRPGCDMGYLRIPFDPAILQRAKERVLRVESWVAADRTDWPDCPSAHGAWGCPYVYLHDEPEWEPVDPADEPHIDHAAETWAHAVELEKRAKALKADAKRYVESLVETYRTNHPRHLGPIRLRSKGARMTWIREDIPERTTTTKAHTREYPRFLLDPVEGD